MASGRMLQRRISKNEAIATAAAALDASMGFGHGGYGALLFTWAIAHQDVEGRIEGDPRIVRGNVFPMLEWITSSHVEAYIRELAGAGLLVWYEVAGKRYIVFPGFDGAQPYLRKDRESASVLPSPDGARVLAGSFPVDAGVTPAELPQDSGEPPALKREVRSSNPEREKERAPAPAQQPGDNEAREFASRWGKATGVLADDGYQLGLVREKLADYATTTREEPISVERKAFRAFLDEVAGWTAPRPLTAKLFNAKWSEVQARMGGKLPTSSAKPRASPGRSGPLPPMEPITESKTEVLPP